MTNSYKDAVIIHLTNLIIDNNKGLSFDDYDFEDGDEFSIYIKRANGLKMMVSLHGFDKEDIINDTFEWQSHKNKVLNLFNKLNELYATLVNDGTKSDFQIGNKRIDLLCKIDSYLPKKLIEFFIKDKDDLYIVNPCAYLTMNVFLLSFKNINTLRQFIESKLFFKINDIF